MCKWIRVMNSTTLELWSTLCLLLYFHVQFSSFFICYFVIKFVIKFARKLVPKSNGESVYGWTSIFLVQSRVKNVILLPHKVSVQHNTVVCGGQGKAHCLPSGRGHSWFKPFCRAKIHCYYISLAVYNRIPTPHPL